MKKYFLLLCIVSVVVILTSSIILSQNVKESLQFFEGMTSMIEGMGNTTNQGIGASVSDSLNNALNNANNVVQITNENMNAANSSAIFLANNYYVGSGSGANRSLT